MPIRKALVALLPAALFLCISHSPAGAAPKGGDRPAAALVASSETHFRSGASEELTPLGLAALVAAGWLPALVLLTRRRRQRTSGGT
jgi:hypothetical protein